MTKRFYWKALFISLLGIAAPIVSGIFDYSKYSAAEIFGADLLFIVYFLLILSGNDWMWKELKNVSNTIINSFLKKASPWLISLLYSSVAGGVVAVAWMKFSNDTISKTSLIIFLVICTVLIGVYDLVHEMFLFEKEKKIERHDPNLPEPAVPGTKVALLRNELDPHFIFNSLTTLSHLIIHEAQKAHVFNSKLSSVYKYFLLNKDKELISLTQELEFIENYFYLLQVRYDNKVQMQVEPATLDEKALILPCALQILVENALKHNEYSEDDPLEIKISVNKHYLKVTNNVKPKPYLVNSSRIGLNNLNSRYRLVCNKNIEIENSIDQFVVKLPLIRQEKSIAI